ncbi:hypothetical protein EJ04DRAFT_528117 [Polyplosphaeria fusca]|uniref:Uncharacterized protein n=1 Tax=Polyplosphaeria fusca TaxID=682080 RepID=A0A9P4UYC3_9PLEO|nr:hypothetical protein EJ04DRAFT_528117 [Polyplosphaeria fusca]
MAVQFFASLLIRVGLLGLGLGTAPERMDLLHGGVKGAITEATIKNTCVFSVTGIPGTVNPTKQADVSISAWLRCDDKDSLVGSWIGVPADKDLQVSDARIGDLTLNFQSSNFKTYPFPGDLIIHNAYFKDTAFKDGIGMKNCINFSKKGELDGKDCKGDDVILSACDEGFFDGSDGVINDENIQKKGWRYVMAMPLKDVNPGCPSGKRGVEFEGVDHLHGSTTELRASLIVVSIVIAQPFVRKLSISDWRAAAVVVVPTDAGAPASRGLDRRSVVLLPLLGAEQR